MSQYTLAVKSIKEPRLYWYRGADWSEVPYGAEHPSYARIVWSDFPQTKSEAQLMSELFSSYRYAVIDRKHWVHEVYECGKTVNGYTNEYGNFIYPKKSCPICKGKGVIELFTSIEKCSCVGEKI